MTDIQVVEDHSQNVLGISHLGEVYVVSRFYSETYFKSVNIINTPFEVVPGISGKNFVVTALLIATSKSFGSATTAQTLEIYEAHPADLSINLKTFTSIDFLKNDRLPATGLNIRATEGRTLVASADDIDVSVTLAGYYITST